MKKGNMSTTLKMVFIFLPAMLWGCSGANTQNIQPALSNVQVTATSANTAPANITITANVTDIDGTVARVEFYNGATKLGEVASPPYQYVLKDAPAGTYDIRVKAIDNGGGSTTATSSVTIGEGTLVYVEGGTFTMGDNTNAKSTPAHSVSLTGYYISKYSVTFDDFDTYTADTGRTQVVDTFGAGRGKIPVTNVSWYDAIQYCNWRSIREGLVPVYTIDKVNKDSNNNNTADTLKWTVTANAGANGYRLPTEAEWEFASRGGNKSQGFIYSGSNNVKEVAWYGGKTVAQGRYTTGTASRKGDQHEVGLLKPNELGLYDMSGNAAQWVWDKYDQARPGYAASQSGVTETNPTGITGRYDKFVFRGGTSGGRWDCMLPARRFTKDPAFTMCPAGFRLARSTAK